MTQAIEGSVDNGRRGPISFDKYTGPAGIRERQGHMEVAYLGDPPRRFPIVGTVEGVAATAIGRADTRTLGMVVLIVTLEGATASAGNAEAV